MYCIIVGLLTNTTKFSGASKNGEPDISTEEVGSFLPNDTLSDVLTEEEAESFFGKCCLISCELL